MCLTPIFLASLLRSLHFFSSIQEDTSVGPQDVENLIISERHIYGILK